MAAGSMDDEENSVFSEDEMDSVSSHSSETATLYKMPKKKAVVWKYFGFLSSTAANRDKPVCSLCHHEVPTKNSNTSNLYSHLKFKHPREYLEVVPSKRSSSTTSSDCSSSSQSSIVNAFERSKMISTSSKEHKELTEAVTRFLAKDCLPIYTVEKKGFIEMIRRFNPRYQLPSRSHFSRVAIPSLYTVIKEKVQSEISSDMEYFSSTTDLWSSATMQPYISYSIHFIDRNWNLRSYCLQSHFIPEDHTGVNIKEHLTETLARWNLTSDMQVVLTTDSGANIKLAAQLLKWDRLSCFGHNLDLAVKKGLEDKRVQRVLAVCRKIVSAFSHSWKRRREMGKIQEEKNLPSHLLIGDCKTRWGSSISMIKRILEQQEPIRQVLTADRTASHLALTWQDFDILDSVYSVLNPLCQMTDLLSGEKYVTVSVIKPLLNHIFTNILLNKEEETALSKEMKSRIKEKLISCYTNDRIQTLLSLCSFLDPRFKLCSSSVVPDENSSETDSDIIQLIKEEMATLAGGGGTLTQSQESSEDNGSTIVSTQGVVQQPLKRPRKALVTLSEILGNKSGSSTSTILPISERIDKEVDFYTHSPNIETDGCPLSWWKEEQKRLPLLAKVAKKYLCICATSVASERIFSTGGNVVSDNRTCTKPDMVNYLVFLSRNL